MSCESIRKFKYLGTTITDKNASHEEIKDRLNLGNVCYHSVKNLLCPVCIHKNMSTEENIYMWEREG
jgi:hypothetical protein